MMRGGLCAIDERVVAAELDEIALTFEPRAGGGHRCEMRLSLPAALALDAQGRR